MSSFKRRRKARNVYAVNIFLDDRGFADLHGCPEWSRNMLQGRAKPSVQVRELATGLASLLLASRPTHGQSTPCVGSRPTHGQSTNLQPLGCISECSRDRANSEGFWALCRTIVRRCTDLARRWALGGPAAAALASYSRSSWQRCQLEHTRRPPACTRPGDASSSGGAAVAALGWRT